MSQYDTANFGEKTNKDYRIDGSNSQVYLKRIPTAQHADAAVFLHEQAVEKIKIGSQASKFQQSSSALESSWHRYDRQFSAISNSFPQGDSAADNSSIHESQMLHVENQQRANVVGNSGFVSEGSPPSNPSVEQSERNALAGYLNPLHSSTDQASNEAATGRTVALENDIGSRRNLLHIHDDYQFGQVSERQPMDQFEVMKAHQQYATGQNQ